MDDGDPLLEYLGWVRPRWHADAACKEHPTVDFFPTAYQSADAAKAVCASCLVRVECEAAGIDGREAGIWGGLSERGRRRIRATEAQHAA